MASSKTYRVKTKGGVFAEVDGVEYHLQEGELIAGDHALIKALPNDLEPAEDAVRYAVEDASADPGRKRGAAREASK